MHVRAGVASNVGLVRQTNEDSYLVGRNLYVVCDGMGGARAGEVASEMACRGLSSLDPKESGAEELAQAVRDVNRAIAVRSFEADYLLGMGTTLTGALVGRDLAWIAHVGDSRAYLLHEGTLRQLTDDHSWVGEMMRRGELTPNEAAVHPHRSVITKALGTDTEVEPDILETPFVAGDRLLLCSDGLTGMVSDQDIAQILGRDDEPGNLASLLVQAALAGGGEDNVTVVVVEALSEPDDVDSEGDETADLVVGPTERGSSHVHRTGVNPLRGRRPSTAVRERLGKKVGPFLRPPAEPGEQSPAPEDGDDPVVSNTAGTEDSVESAPVAVPTSPGRRSWGRRWLVVAVIVVVVIALAAVGFAVVNSTVYYVGVSEGGVALYRGLPFAPLGVGLSHVIEQGSVTYESLAPYMRSRVDAHELVTKEEGQNFLRSLSAMP